MKRIIYASLLIVLGLSGCAILNQLFDPNNVKPIEAGAAVIGAIATGAGQPWGVIITGLAGGLATLAAIYRNYRNQIKSAEKYQAIEITTKSIVDAIEATSALPAKEGTVGDLVKAAVKTKLSENNIYKIGKSIITALKQ